MLSRCQFASRFVKIPLNDRIFAAIFMFLELIMTILMCYNKPKELKNMHVRNKKKAKTLICNLMIHISVLPSSSQH